MIRVIPEDRLPKATADSLPEAEGWLGRPFLIAFGWLNVALGTAGVFLPVMPTTVFLLIALWAFSKSSRRFHDWLYNHPRLGPFVHDWQRHRIIPVRAKILAVVMMAGSAAYLVHAAPSWQIPLLASAAMALVAAWIVTRPSRIPT